uniref:Uncharacterized protein n=1 Tax=Rhizophora mucronata TaxID=61149 RepID=A0A2P2NZW8_RHIMU
MTNFGIEKKTLIWQEPGPSSNNISTKNSSRSPTKCTS